jgi:hypothetical protein
MFFPRVPSGGRTKPTVEDREVAFALLLARCHCVEAEISSALGIILDGKDQRICVLVAGGLRPSNDVKEAPRDQKVGTIHSKVSRAVERSFAPC